MKIPAAIASSSAFVQMYTCINGSYNRVPNVNWALNTGFPDISKRDWQYVEAVLDLDKIKLSAPTTNLSIRCYIGYTGTTTPIYVDEVRIHPFNAQMSTFTYKPGVGKTSEAGPGSKPMQYEYDIFGRLLYTRDFKRNILQKYQYQLQ